MRITDMFVRISWYSLVGMILFSGLGSHAQASSDRRDLPPGRVGELYRYGVVYQGLVEPVKIKLDGDIPPGLEVKGTIIGGVPSPECSGKTWNLSVIAKDALGTELSRQYSLRIRPALQPLSLDEKQQPVLWLEDAAEYPFLASGGEGEYHWKASALKLPVGLELYTGINGSQCMLRGHPTEIGEIEVDATVTDASGSVVSKTISGRVVARPKPLRFVTEALPPFPLGAEIDFEFAVTGGQGRYRWDVDPIELPDGLEVEYLDERGQCLLKGTPLAVGDIHLSVSVSDAVEKLGPYTVTGRVASVAAPLGIKTDRVPEGMYLIPFAGQLVAHGGRPPYKWMLEWDGGNEPPGVEFNPATGEFSGTPSQLFDGVFHAIVEDVDGTSSARARFGFVIVPPSSKAPRRCLPSSLPLGIAGQEYDAELVLSEYVGLVDWDVSWINRPDWVEKSASPTNRFAIRGRPMVSGEYHLVVKAEDMVPFFGSEAVPVGTATQIEYTLKIIDEKEPILPLEFRTKELPVAVLGHPYPLQLAFHGGDGEVEFINNSSLPDWLEMNAEGLLSGTPEVSGNYEVAVVAADAQSNQVEKLFNLSVIGVEAENKMLVADIPDIMAIQGKPFNFRIPISGGVEPYRVEIKNPLPSGLEYDSTQLRIKGTPVWPGHRFVRFSISDASGSAEETCTFTITTFPSWRSFAIAGVVTCMIIAGYAVCRRLYMKRR